MPDEKPCPVVASYLRHAIDRWTYDVNSSALYQSVVDELKELEEHPLVLVKDLSTQRLRAFHCLHGLFVLLRTRLGGPVHKLPLTREGIQFLIKFCEQERDAAEVKLYTNQLLGGSMTVKLDELSTQALIDLTNTIIEASEYLRPRLVNGDSLAGMGRLFSQGLKSVGAPSDSYIRHGRDLIHATSLVSPRSTE